MCATVTYDYGGSFFNGPSTCGFSSEQFNSRSDCNFNAENGEVIAAFIAIGVVVAVVVFCCCLASNGVFSDENCMSSPAPSTSKPPRPAYTPEEIAPLPIAVTSSDRPESMRVCPILATDVVLVSSAPVEEPVAIPAESEIVFSLPYDISVVPRVTIKPAAAVEKVM
jgi:hypothetical protein